MTRQRCHVTCDRNQIHTCLLLIRTGVQTSRWLVAEFVAPRAGLQKFVAESQLEEAVKKEAQEETPKPGALGTGTDKIYVGKGQYIKVWFNDVILRPGLRMSCG